MKFVKQTNTGSAGPARVASATSKFGRLMLGVAAVAVSMSAAAQAQDRKVLLLSSDGTINIQGAKTV